MMGDNGRGFRARKLTGNVSDSVLASAELVGGGRAQSWLAEGRRAQSWRRKRVRVRVRVLECPSARAPVCVCS